MKKYTAMTCTYKEKETYKSYLDKVLICKCPLRIQKIEPFSTFSDQLTEFSKVIQIMQPKFQNIGLRTQMEVASACKFPSLEFISSVLGFLL